jgi:hypothetical protein
MVGPLLLSLQKQLDVNNVFRTVASRLAVHTSHLKECLNVIRIRA